MKILLFILLSILPLAAAPSSEQAASYMSSLHQDSGGYKNLANDPLPTIAATNMAMRTFRYLGIELTDTAIQKDFLLSRFDKSKAAFVENGEKAPTVLANAMALMLMAELRMPEDVHAVSARDFLVANASTAPDIYMAVAGLAVMDLAHEIPASWIKQMMDIALSEDSAISQYDKARAIITCMRTGLNLPDYTLFAAPLGKYFSTLVSKPFSEDPTALQEAYTIGRALVMIDARSNIPLPALEDILSKHPPLAALYRLSALQNWQPKLHGQITVAICTGFAPVGYRDATGEITGMDADLFRAFAKANGYELEFIEQTRFNGIWILPARGIVDAATSGISKRRDRLTPGIRWSYPYFGVDRSLSILKSNADRFRSIADLDGMKIAVTAGTTGEKDTHERNPQAILVPYDNEEAAIRDLLAGKVHALARGDVSNRWDTRVYPQLAIIDTHPMDPAEEFVVAVASERVALGQKLDKWLRESRSNGELDKLFAKYLQN